MQQKIYSTLFLSAFFSCLLFISCNNSAEKTLTNKDTIPKISAVEMGIEGNFSTQQKLKFDSTDIIKFLDSFPQFKIFNKEINSFYINRSYAYAWYDENGMIEPAHNLFNRIQNISEEGVPDMVPYKDRFINLIDSAVGNDSASPVLELMLTSQYFAYAKRVWQGLDEKESLEMEWYLPRKKITSQQLLDSMLTGKNTLENSSVFKQYRMLKEYLKKYNFLKGTASFAKTISTKNSYQLSDSSSSIGAIRERLFLLGDLKENTTSNRFDTSLVDAVKNFQRRLGYKEDGKINSTLLAEMNTPIEKRIEQILVNMERCRWVPVQLKSNYLIVNIPEFKLHVYDQDSIAFSMNVVVGKYQNKTVVFNGEMNQIVFSPYWNIPSSILKKEILPAIRRNSNYLARHNMEWNGGNVRQKPGPNNSLGLVKFLFPNSHSIYLHDTPAKSLFNEERRAFSHGCIRVAEPKKLANYLLRADENWNEENITKAMEKGTEQYVTLKKKIPVFIAYFTAWVDRKGQLNFRQDVYKRDSRLAKLILKKPII